MFRLCLNIFLVVFLFATQLKSQTNCSSFSTYFGGGLFDEIKGVCIDANKNSYVIGNTYSTNLPVTLGLINDTASGNYDVFLAKLDSCGGLIWCTYFGTPNFDSGEKIKMAKDGNLVLCGYTDGTTLATTSGCFQSTNNGSYDCFVTKITPNGTIIWNTYFGKSSGDFAYDIETDVLDNIIVGGTTTSPNLYTTASSFQPNIKANTDAFIARFNKNGVFKWCTYYGGNGNEDIHALTTDSDCNIIGVGGSFSTNLNTSASAYQAYNDGGPDIYILKLDSNCTRVFSSYLGGSGVEDAWGVVTDSNNNIYLSGHTNSYDFDTTALAYQTIKKGSYSDWYITKWSPTGSLLNSTLFGGLDNDLLSRMIFVSPNYILLIGISESIDFPILGFNNQSSLSGNYDGGLALFDATTMFPTWSSYYGGVSDEELQDVACDINSCVVFVGSTNSSDYPLSSSPYQPLLNMSRDGIVTKLPLNNLVSTTINDLFLTSSYNLFPNPFNDFITIDCNVTFSLEIKNMLGQSVYFDNNKKTIYTSDLSSGIYFITLTNKGFAKTYKLIKH